MIKNVQRYHTERERERVEFLRQLTYEESSRRAAVLLSSGLLEQVQLRAADHPVSLRRLLRGRAR